MGRKRDERIEKTKARLEDAAEMLKDRADKLGQKKPRRRRRLLPLAGLVAGVVALLRKTDVREKGKGVVDRAGPLAGKAREAGQTLAGKAREGVSRLKGG